MNFLKQEQEMLDKAVEMGNGIRLASDPFKMCMVFRTKQKADTGTHTPAAQTHWQPTAHLPFKTSVGKIVRQLFASVNYKCISEHIQLSPPIPPLPLAAGWTCTWLGTAWISRFFFFPNDCLLQLSEPKRVTNHRQRNWVGSGRMVRDSSFSHDLL